jgi:hypothetical protein
VQTLVEGVHLVTELLLRLLVVGHLLLQVLTISGDMQSPTWRGCREEQSRVNITHSRWGASIWEWRSWVSANHWYRRRLDNSRRFCLAKVLESLM